MTQLNSLKSNLRVIDKGINNSKSLRDTVN